MVTAATGRLNDSSSARGIGCSVEGLGGRFVFASSQHAPSFFIEDVAKRYDLTTPFSASIFYYCY